jgi:hypothetical protein
MFGFVMILIGHSCHSFLVKILMNQNTYKGAHWGSTMLTPCSLNSTNVHLGMDINYYSSSFLIDFFRILYFYLATHELY